jgi:hypothetical protein
MAATIQIAGPTVIKVTIGESESTLGYSDNDTLPAVNFTEHQHDVRTVLSGAVPEEIVLQGTSARISLALVKWDETVLTAVLTKQRGGDGTTSPVGARIVANTRFFALSIEALGSGATYTFPCCYLQQDGVGDSQWGNRERVLTLNLMAIPNPAQPAEIFTYTDGTAQA